MAVDYAAKRRDRGGRGWALRNFKLRLSRKLIFAAGLAMCLSCQLRPSPELAGGHFSGEDDFNGAVEELLFALSARTPLERLAQFALQFEGAEAAGQILDCYERFLAILDDNAKRTELEEMDVDEAAGDELFGEAQEIGTGFQGNRSAPGLSRSEQRAIRRA